MSTTRSVRLVGSPDRPLVVALASLGTPSALWDDVTGRLADRWRFAFVEHPGHVAGAGPSPVAERMDAYADEIIATLDALEVASAHVVGVSIGGALGLELSARFPSRIGRVVAIGVGPRFGTPELWLERARTVRELGTDRLADDLLDRWAPREWWDAHPPRRREVRSWVAACDDEAYARHCHALAAWEAPPLDDRRASATLLITGAHDPVAPPELVLALAAGRSPVVVLPRSRHLPVLDAPAAVATLVDVHLAGAMDDPPTPR